MLGVSVTVLQQPASNLFHSVSKLSQKNSAASQVLKTLQKYLFKMMLKSFPKYPKVSKV